MAQEIDKLFVTIGANIDDLKKGMSQAANVLDRQGKKLQQVGANLSLAISAPVGILAGAAINAAGDFEAAINRVGAISQASATQLKQLENAAKDLGATTSFTATEAASGIETLARNGLQVEQILGGTLDATLSLAAATGTDLANAADIATDVIAQFNRSAGEMEGVVDTIVGATIKSKFSIDDFRLAIGQAGGVAGKTGIEFEDFAAGIAATSSAFASGSDAGTSFKNFLVRLNPASKEASETMKQLGLNFFDANGGIKSLSEIAGDLQKAFKGLSEQQRLQAAETIFGSDALRTAITLAEGGAGAFDDLSSSISKVSAAQQAETRLQGFNGALKQLQSALESLQIAIADAGILDFLTELTTDAAEFVRGLRDVDPAVFRFAAALSALAIALPPILAGLGTIAIAVGALGGPITAAITALGVLGAGFVAVQSSTDDAAKSFENQQQKVKELEGSLPALIKRYEELKDSDATTEQEELRKVIEQIGGIVPTAVTEFDKYGKALDISTTAAKKFVEQQKLLLQARNAEAIEEQSDKLQRYERQLDSVNRKLEQGGTSLPTTSGRQILVPFDEDALVKARQQVAILQDQIQGTKDYIDVLTGANIVAEENAEVTEDGAAKTKEGTEEVKRAIPIYEQYIKKIEGLEEAIKSATSSSEISKLTGELESVQDEFNNIFNPTDSTSSTGPKLDVAFTSGTISDDAFDQGNIVDVAKVLNDAFEEELNFSDAIEKEISALVDADLAARLGEPIEEVAKTINVAALAIDTFGSTLNSALSSGASAFQAFASAAVAAIGSVIKALIQQAVAQVIAKSAAQGSLLAGPAGIAIAAAAGVVAQGAFTGIVGGIRGFASGARSVASGLAIVGEQGPELVNLPGGSDVFSNRQLRGAMMGADSGGGNVEFKLRGEDLYGSIMRHSTRTSKLF